MRSDSVIEIIDLHPNEVRLIKAMRSRWRFGTVQILVRDGLPFRMERTQEFVDLAKPFVEQVRDGY